MEDTFSAGISPGNVGSSDSVPSNLPSQQDIQDLQSSGGKYGFYIMPMNTSLNTLKLLYID